MLKISLTFFFLLLLANYLPNNSCACQPLPDNAKTKTGWMSHKVTEEKPVKSIQGKVVDANGKSLIGSYVEIFKADNVVPDETNDVSQQKRIAGCEIEENGKFSFPRLSSGKYELRVSQQYFDTVSMYVDVSPKGIDKKMEVMMKVSD